MEGTRKEYDFSRGKRNACAAKLEKQITIRLDDLAVDYFKDMAEETGIEYQTMIKLYLGDCALHNRALALKWHGK